MPAVHRPVDIVRPCCRPALQRHRSFLQFDIGMDVDLRRLDRFMAQPESNDCSINTTLQKLHRGSVAQNMGRDALQSECRTV